MKKFSLILILFFVLIGSLYANNKLAVTITKIDEKPSGFTYFHYEIYNHTEKNQWVKVIITYYDTNGRFRKVNVSHTVLSMYVKKTWQGIEDYGSGINIMAYY